MPAVAIQTGRTPLDNGGFENGTNPPPSVFYDFWGSRPLPAGNTDLDGWKVAGNGVDWTGGLWIAADGTKSIDLSGTNQQSASKAGSIWQDITGLKAGTEYTITFKLSGNFQGPPVDAKDGRLTIDDETHDFRFERPADWSEGNMGFVDNSFTFTFDGTGVNANRLTFASLEDTFYGPVIDDVRLSVTHAGSDHAFLV